MRSQDSVADGAGYSPKRVITNEKLFERDVKKKNLGFFFKTNNQIYAVDSGKTCTRRWICFKGKFLNFSEQKFTFLFFIFCFLFLQIIKFSFPQAVDFVKACLVLGDESALKVNFWIFRYKNLLFIFFVNKEPMDVGEENLCC